MSQKAEVKVVVNTAEAQAALKRLEAEALRIEAEVMQTGRKAKASNYKNAKANADGGHASHSAAAGGTGGGGVGTATAVAAGAVGAQVSATLSRVELNSKGSVRQYLQMESGAIPLNKGTYQADYAAMLHASNRGWGINPNLAASIAKARTKFVGMETLDQSRLHAAAMRSASSVRNNLYGWFSGSKPKQALLDDHIEKQIISDYNRTEAAELKVKKKTEFRSKLLKKTPGWIKRIYNSVGAGASLAFGAGGVRAFLGKLLGGVALGMTVKQIGEESANRLGILERKGYWGYAENLVTNVVRPAWNFTTGVISSGAGIVFEGIGIVSHLFGGSKQARKWAQQVEANQEGLKWGKGDEMQEKFASTANDLGKLLTSFGRWGSENENRNFAMQALIEAERTKDSRDKIGNQGWLRRAPRNG